MKVLVIGASGLLGKPVAEALDRHGFQLRLFSRNVNPSMFINEHDIVRGDVFNPQDLDNAINGCDAIHISLSSQDDVKAVTAIIDSAKRFNIKLISLVSGCTVKEENRWFSFVDNKFRSEQLLFNSGIPYIIFRPTWFFESLGMMFRDGKATLLGNQPNPYHFVAADDFAEMVASAYSNEEAANNIFFVYGPKSYLMKDLMEEYRKAFHPEIKKVTVAPLPMLKFIAWISRNKQLKFATEMFSYFQKVQEPEVADITRGLVYKPELDFDKWLELKK